MLIRQVTWVVRLMEEGGMFSNQENGSYLDVVDDNELSSAFAQTLPNGIIRVRESIYNNAYGEKSW